MTALQEFQIEQEDAHTVRVRSRGVECYRLQREAQRAVWALFRVSNGVVGERLDREASMSALIDRLKGGVYAASR